jgi:outer membrane protein assembly factor BamA
MTRLLTAVLALGLTGATASAQDVEVSGHRSMSARAIRSVLLDSAADGFSEERLTAGVDSLLLRLAELGRPFACVKVSWEDGTDDVSLHVEIDEGPQVRLTPVLTTSEGDSEEPVAPPADARIEAAATGPALRRGVAAILDAYGDAGYPFARITLPAEVNIEGGSARIELLVEPGTETRFGEVVVSGNEQTRDHVIARETGVVPGEPYSRRIVRAIRPRLERLGFLRTVAEPVVAVDPADGRASVGVEVEEAAANRISGVLGLAGSGGDEEINGLVDLTLGNIAGTGRAASVRWEQFRRGETEIAFSYVEPWLLGAPVDVGVSGAQAVRDTLYTTTEGDLSVTARVGGRTRLTWSLGAVRFVPGSDDESSTTSTRTSLSVDHDARDVPFNPSGGHRVTAGAVYAAKEAVDSGEDESSGTFKVGLERYLTVARGQVVALIGRAALVSSTEDDVPFHEQLTLGGARSLRGYREEQFRGTRTGLATAEYRFLLTRRSRALAFIDVGYWYRGGSNAAKGTKLGYGIGLRGETRLGTISVDYGLGEGDGLLDGKLHAGLVREF